MSKTVYWPVLWSRFEDGPGGLAFFSNEDMAKHIAGLFRTLGSSADVCPPVHLSIFDTFLPEPT